MIEYFIILNLTARESCTPNHTQLFMYAKRRAMNLQCQIIIHEKRN